MPAQNWARFGGCAGKLKPPPVYADPVLEMLRTRGAEHERSYIAKRKTQGLRILDLSDVETAEASLRDADRAQLVSSPDALFSFVTQNFAPLFQIADVIDAELVKLGR